MPKLNIDQFEDAPNVGDKIKVLGKVKSIDEDSGMVEVSYDDVSIVKEKSKKKRKDNDSEDDADFVEIETMPNTQSLDEALAQTFPNTQ